MGFVILIVGAVITFGSSIILKKFNNYTENKNLIIKLIGLLIAMAGMLLIIYK